VRWDRQIDVEMTTLDLLIERFGKPAFVKMDVEGAEAGVLASLSEPIRTLSFEFLPTALDAVEECTRRVRALGAYRFNWSYGESYRLAEPRWITAAELGAALQTQRAQKRAGDVYARLEP
jgi:hypothetical protein